MCWWACARQRAARASEELCILSRASSAGAAQGGGVALPELKSSPFPLITQVTLRTDSEQKSLFNLLCFTSGSFVFSCPIRNNVLGNTSKSFGKRECVYRALKLLQNKENLGTGLWFLCFVLFCFQCRLCYPVDGELLLTASGMEMCLLWIRQTLLLLLLITSVLMNGKFVLQLENQLI